MKSNWQIKKLEEACEVFADGDWIEKKDQSISGIRLIQTGNIGNGYFFDRSEKARYISEGTFKRLRCTEVLPGDCLLSRLPDPVGRASLIPDTSQKMITAVDCTIMRFKKDTLPKWFIYFSLSPDYQKEINKEVTGATRQRISRSNLGNIEISVPPIPEQKRIVKILDEVFEKTAKAKENAEKNLQNSRELFESYLQNFFANPGDGWGKKKLGEVCEYFNGKAHEQCIDEKGKYIVINSKFISSDGRIFKRTDNILFLLSQGDIVMVLSDVPNGKALAKCYLIEKDNTYSLNQRICVIRSNKFYTKFLYYQLNRNKHFLSFDNGENQTNLRLNQILSCPLFVPPISVQKKIADKIDAFADETKKLEAVYQRKLTDLDELKKSILQKAFKGKLIGVQL